MTLNQLHLPVNRPAVVEITTKDVIHSFFLPVMRVKQDAIPGMMIPIHFVPTKTSDEMREELAFTLTLPTTKDLDPYVSMEDYKAADGTVLVKKGRLISKDAAAKLGGQWHHQSASGLITRRRLPAPSFAASATIACGVISRLIARRSMRRG